MLFIDEFDGVGKQRSMAGGGNDESVHTINQLLTEMDGFEDNTGVVVMAATNRPAALDTALTRPGRFDRILQLPMPNLEVRSLPYVCMRACAFLDYVRQGHCTILIVQRGRMRLCCSCRQDHVPKHMTCSMTCRSYTF